MSLFHCHGIVVEKYFKIRHFTLVCVLVCLMSAYTRTFYNEAFCKMMNKRGQAETVQIFDRKHVKRDLSFHANSFYVSKNVNHFYFGILLKLNLTCVQEQIPLGSEELEEMTWSLFRCKGVFHHMR